jgi:hypothetical protein
MPSRTLTRTPPAGSGMDLSSPFFGCGPPAPDRCRGGRRRHARFLLDNLAADGFRVAGASGFPRPQSEYQGNLTPAAQRSAQGDKSRLQ